MAYKTRAPGEKADYEIRRPKEGTLWENLFRIEVVDRQGTRKEYFAVVTTKEKWGKFRRPTTQDLATARLFGDEKAERKLSQDEQREVRRALVGNRFSDAASIKFAYMGNRAVEILEMVPRAAQEAVKSDAVRDFTEQKPEPMPRARRRRITIEIGEVTPVAPRKKAARQRPKEHLTFEPEVVERSRKSLEDERREKAGRVTVIDTPFVIDISRKKREKPKEPMTFEPDEIRLSDKARQQKPAKPRSAPAPRPKKAPAPKARERREDETALALGRRKQSQDRIAAIIERELGGMKKGKAPAIPETKAPDVGELGKQEPARRPGLAMKGAEEGGRAVAIPEGKGEMPKERVPAAEPKEEMPAERVPAMPAPSGRRMPAGVYGKGSVDSPFVFTAPLSGGDAEIQIPKIMFRVGLTAFHFKPTVQNFDPEKHSPEQVAAAIAEKLFYAVRAVSSEKVDRAAMQKDIADNLRRTGIWSQ